MQQIDWKTLANQMIAAALTVFGSEWPSVAVFVSNALTEYVADVRLVTGFIETNQLSATEGGDMIRMEKDTLSIELTTAKGISELVAEQAINAAYGVLAAALNVALGSVVI